MTGSIKPDQWVLDRINNDLQYDPETGLITWKRNDGQMIKDQIAGTISHEYRNIDIRQNYKRKTLRGHCIAWYLYYGVWPSLEIDHKDLNKLNNKINNLRLATHRQNQLNRKVQLNNKLGEKNILFHKNRFIVQFKKNSKPYILGHFKTLDEAIIVRNEHAKTLGDFARI